MPRLLRPVFSKLRLSCNSSATCNIVSSLGTAQESLKVFKCQVNTKNINTDTNLALQLGHSFRQLITTAELFPQLDENLHEN